MSTIHFIGGEKGGVGKSVMSRALSQYMLDNNLLYAGFDADQSHNTLARFYPEFTQAINIDNYEGADQIVEKLTNDEEQNDSNYSDLSGYPESEHEDPDPEQSGTDDIKLSQDTQSEQDGKVEPTQAEDVST